MAKIKAGPVKKPCAKKGGVVAERGTKAERLALQEDRNRRKKQRIAFKLASCRRPLKPLRIKRNGSRKRKRDADKTQQRRLRIRSGAVMEEIGLIIDNRLGDDELAVALGLGADANDVVALVNGDLIDGDGSFGTD